MIYARHQFQPPQLSKGPGIVLLRNNPQPLGQQLVQRCRRIQKFSGITVSDKCRNQFGIFIHAKPVDFIRNPVIPVKTRLRALEQYVPHPIGLSRIVPAHIDTGGQKHNILQTVPVQISKHNGRHAPAGLLHHTCRTVIGFPLIRPVDNLPVFIGKKKQQASIFPVKRRNHGYFSVSLHFNGEYVLLHHFKPLLRNIPPGLHRLQAFLVFTVLYHGFRLMFLPAGCIVCPCHSRRRPTK